MLPRCCPHQVCGARRRSRLRLTLSREFALAIVARDHSNGKPYSINGAVEAIAEGSRTALEVVAAVSVVWVEKGA